MARQLAIARRVSLKGIGPDWGDDCYAYVMPANYPDMLANDGIAEKSKADQVKFQTEFVEQHFVSGKVRLFGSGDIVDMEASDAAASIEISDRLFAGIIGVDLDPKGQEPAAVTPQVPENDEKPTETPSSTDSRASLPTQPEN